MDTKETRRNLKDGSGKGVGMPDGLRRNENLEPCDEKDIECQKKAEGKGENRKQE